MPQYEGCHLRVDRSTPPRHKAGALFVPVFDGKTSVFIHNLVPEVLDEDIINFFTGQKVPALKESIVAVRLIRDQRLRQCKGIGYVKFKTRKAVTEALKLNGTSFQGRKLKVNSVKIPKKPRGMNVMSIGSWPFFCLPDISISLEKCVSPNIDRENFRPCIFFLQMLR